MTAALAAIAAHKDMSASLYSRAEVEALRATAWLIEFTPPGDSRLFYFTVDERGYRTYTTDANKALRFHRKEDAEMMLCDRAFFNMDGIHAIQHSWVPE